MIIQKRADELKPGDILAKKGLHRAVVIATSQLNPQCVSIIMVRLGSTGYINSPALPATNEAPFDVEVPDPKVSDDDLADLIKAARAWLNGSVPTISDRDLIARLVDKLSPPNPPTLDEVLLALTDAAQWVGVDPERYSDGIVEAGKVGNRVDSIIQRARHAGMIK